MTGAKVGVLDSVRAAVAFAQANAPKVLGVLALIMVLNVAGALSADRDLQGLFTGLSILASLMANAALLRLAFADEHAGDPEFQIGFQGFQFGKPELRLGAAFLLIGFFLLLAVVVVVFLVFVLTLALLVGGHGQSVTPADASKLPPAVQAMIALLMAVLAGVMLWAGVRLCLYSPATITEKRVQVFSTWGLTKGASWPIFASLMLAAAPALLTAAVVVATASVPAVQTVAAIVSAAVAAFVEPPLLCGLYAHLYRLRRSGMAAPGLVETPRTGVAGPWG